MTLLTALLLLAPVAAPPPAALAPGCRRSEIYVRALTAQGFDGEDLDGDGEPDLLRMHPAVKSGVAGPQGKGTGTAGGRAHLELRLSSLGAPLEIEPAEASKGAFVNATPVPPALLGPRFAAARKAVAAALFEVSCDAPDPSLAWMLDASHALRWLPGRPGDPSFYEILLDEPAAASRAMALGPREGEPPHVEAAWVFYLGANHAPAHREGAPVRVWKRLAARDGLELLGSAHGVVLYDRKRDRSAWLLVEERVAKLRWPSVFGARLEGDEAVVDVRSEQGEARGVARVQLSTGAVSEKLCRRSEREELPAECRF